VIEDAETLGALLSGVESRAQVSELMTAYEDIRYPRCEQMYKQHWHLDNIFKCPIGPQQELRDHKFRQTLLHDDWDMSELGGMQAVMGDHLTSFAYDATEAVEDWRASKVENTPLHVWVSQE
jgi:salicylate hydroxylase